ncbi:MAG TPA: phosphoenolpyruvate carboxylase, partial [Flavisolibacter sp.]|nr:phosphoenolpyruvate carboxylase [Flavisolibacter sp.]
MDHLSELALENFKNHVGIKFQLYNSLFTSLPFHRIEKTGILLSLFLNACEEGYKGGASPSQIVDDFFKRFTSLTSVSEQTDLLFRFVQYVERQVVLFDALEDASFKEINDVSGIGSLKQLEAKVLGEGLGAELVRKLQHFSVSLVLTAHPTQFYPGTVLGIIDDLSKALNQNEASNINRYLQQLGKTPLFKNQRPSPYDEAVSLIWYLENVFYDAIGNITSWLKMHYPEIDYRKNRVLKMGFWPGGDRDGNPNVTTETTLRVAAELRSSIIRCYYRDVRSLKRRLTFKGVEHELASLEQKLYHNIFGSDESLLKREELLDPLYSMRDTLNYEHNGLFVHLLENLIDKVEVFGMHFATLDMRQESSVHGEVFKAIAEKEQVLPADWDDLDEGAKINFITGITGSANAELYEGIVRDTLESVQAVKVIQEKNGPWGCERYIISQCGTALNVMEVYGLFRLCGDESEVLNVDIVPLFETIEDLKRAPSVMLELYGNQYYRQHLAHRKGKQTIMVGFSDGTKDGGYLMANWSIYKAKEELTRVSREAGIEVLFFDGRGGPPARGGGKTHKFYSSIGRHISTQEIQLTVQGQTVSTSFGNVDAAQYNMEQLLNAGLNNALFAEGGKTLSAEQEEAVKQLSETSYTAYKGLKEHPDF